MNLVWLKLIKRILTHKYYVAKFSFTEFSRAIKYWDDNISSLANECRILGYSQTFLHHRGRNPHHYDFWRVVERILPRLKKDIMKRDGRVVIRPDSGDPVDIICGLRTNPHYHTAMKEGKYYCDFNPFMDDDESHYVEVSEGQYYGAYYMLGKIFGWNTTVNDYRYPSTKVGLLYGDSITLERQRDIYARLENAHMAACNLVLGIGSYTYQFKPRDSLGFAVKATACIINGKLIEIYKHPKTDDGTKNSLKGLIRIEEENGKYVAYDQGCRTARLS